MTHSVDLFAHHACDMASLFATGDPSSPTRHGNTRYVTLCGLRGGDGAGSMLRCRLRHINDPWSLAFDSGVALHLLLEPCYAPCRRTSRPDPSQRSDESIRWIDVLRRIARHSLRRRRFDCRLWNVVQGKVSLLLWNG